MSGTSAVRPREAATSAASARRGGFPMDQIRSALTSMLSPRFTGTGQAVGTTRESARVTGARAGKLAPIFRSRYPAETVWL